MKNFDLETETFGYTDQEDIEWARESASTSKTGLPYGVSPSARKKWSEARRKEGAKDIKEILIMPFYMLIVFILSGYEIDYLRKTFLAEYPSIVMPLIIFNVWMVRKLMLKIFKWR